MVEVYYGRVKVIFDGFVFFFITC